jgi:hypothetical protein
MKTTTEMQNHSGDVTSLACRLIDDSATNGRRADPHRCARPPREHADAHRFSVGNRHDRTGAEYGRGVETKALDERLVAVVDRLSTSGGMASTHEITQPVPTLLHDDGCTH